MNKNKWSYKYDFTTVKEYKDFLGQRKYKYDTNTINIITNLGKNQADKLVDTYVENYEYPNKVVDIYYSQLNNRYIPRIYYVGKTKESVGK